MYRAIHFNLCPSNFQIKELEKIFVIATKFWNTLIKINSKYYSLTKKSISKKKLHTFALKFKKYSQQNNYLHSHIYQVLVDRYIKARNQTFEKFLNRSTKYLQLPKTKDILNSIGLKQYENGFKFIGNKLRFNNKNILIKFNNFIDLNPREIKTLTLKRISSSKWVIVIIIKIEDSISSEVFSDEILNQYKNCIFSLGKEVDKSQIGIDVGIKNYLIISNNLGIRNPKFIQEHSEKINKAKQRYQRRRKGSNRYKKARDLHRKHHEKLKNIRKDFLHKISKYLIFLVKSRAKTCNVQPLIITENLNIKELLQNNYRIINKYINDASWQQFIFFLEYKCAEYGVNFIKVNPKFTTQECSKCGNIKKKELGERIHKCEICGLEIDRDLNAAINIENRGKEVFKGWNSPSTQPVRAA